MKSRLMRSIIIRLMVLLALVFVSFASFASSTMPAAATGVYSYNFEESLTPWVPRADCGVVDFSLTRATDDSACPPRLFYGTAYARLSSQESNYDNAGYWMVTSYEETGRVDVTIDLKARNKENCLSDFPCFIIAYVGTTPPTVATQFTNIGDIVNSNWASFHYTGSATPSGTLYVAVGWRQVLGNPDLSRAVGFDCLNVDIESGTGNP